jgi:Ion channel
MRQIFLVIALTLVVIKDLAYAWTTVEFIRIGGDLADRLRDGDGAAVPHFPALMNPFDRLLLRLAGGEALVQKLARTAFTAPAVIVGASLTQFACGASQHITLTRALGIAIALCSIFVLATAVLRRLALGVNDWKTSDVQVPAMGRFSRWAMRDEPGTNKLVYFLVIVYLSVLGFAALYVAFGVGDPTGFMQQGEPMPTESTSWITWLYFSFATLATVGYGDITPVSDAAKIAITCEIAVGPLLLSWLLAVFLSAKHTDDE